MKVANLLAVFIANDVTQTASIISLRAILGIPDHLVDKIAEVQHKTQPLIRRPLLVFPDHAAVSICGSLLHILTTHKRKAHGATIIRSRRSQRSTDPTA